MTSSEQVLRYPVAADGVIGHWLACGTVTTSCLPALRAVLGDDGPVFGAAGRWVLNYWAWDERSKALKKRVYAALPPFTWQPGPAPALHTPGIGGKSWRYAAVEEDQVVDFSLFNFNPMLMQGWLYAGLVVPQAVTLTADLITIGPARLFLNGALHTHYQREFSYVAVQRIPVQLSLQPGLNALYLQGDMLAWREARLALGLRLHTVPAGLTLHLPAGDVDAAAWHTAEAGLNRLLVKQFAFPALPGYLWLADDAPEPVTVEAEVSLPVPENVFQQAAGAAPPGRARLTLKPGERAELPIVTEVVAGMSGMPGENSLQLRLSAADGTPFSLRREIWAGRNAFSHTPYGTYDARVAEARAHLAQMPYDVLSSLAAVEAGQQEFISSAAVGLACHFLEQRNDCADFYTISLLALLYRTQGSPALRPADAARIEAACLGFKYWLDEPGLDAMCYFTENHQILFQVAGYLAGQLWPQRVFSNSGRTGAQQMARQRPRIENWIIRRLQGNYSEWDSNAYMTLDAFAMLALVEFAASPRLRELATALLHRLFFLLASQSFRGVHGSTHGRCYVTALKSARVENTSSLQRIAWGMGIFNGETRATGLLALARRYRVPDILQRIGADVERVLVTKAWSYARFRPQFDMRGDAWDVRTITYRAPEVMLSAAVEHRPGEMGIQEHLWQATLGPEAVIFTTYPGNSQEHGNARPNFWAGSARLPRVVMHDKTVICLYRFEPGVGLGFSHAYFPVLMFDETVLEGPWAFARCGAGYVALWADGDLVLTEHGRHAGQELRSRGTGQAWVCRVGRAAEEGDFASFRARLLAAPPQSAGHRVLWSTPEGTRLALDWAEPLTVDAVPVRFDDLPQYQNAFTDTPMHAPIMTIAHDGQRLTLDLQRGRVMP
ncbi:MAG: hypothetical protein MUE40_17125 [Anaerolineae bacterium]|nr:hypothetical protein [Anaerolineae bacterium]